jgi:hypothetical protein
MAKKRLYYMHPVNTYDTELEREQLEQIAELFEDWEIVNPNQPEHQAECARLKAEGKRYMQYFVDLANSCDGGVFLPFRDGMIGAGIVKEALALVGRECPVWELTHDHCLSHFNHEDDSRFLTVDDTRARIRNPDRSPKPY